MHDIAVIGGGCVGTAIATHLIEASDLDVAIIEKEYHLAQHQSGRNSGVLHPGFNYEPGSLKARFSTEGTRRLKEYARDHDVPLEECGVLVVAQTDEEEQRLDVLQAQADENGVETEIIEGRDSIQDYEPAAQGQAALYCPEAASIDAQEYVYSLAAEAKAGGVTYYMGHEVETVEKRDGQFSIRTSNGEIRANYLVNAAGLYADTIAHGLGVGNQYQIVPFRGEYYELVPERQSVVNSMIYPVPDPELPFLGVHYTRRTDGKVIAGPNAVLAFGREAYDNTDFDPREFAETLSFTGFWKLLASPKMMGVAWEEFNKSYRKAAFVDAAQRLVPSVDQADFTKSYAGIRAQVVTENGVLVKEPLFEHAEQSTHVLNAVSPGLTSSLPFGEHLSAEILDRY